MDINKKRDLVELAQRILVSTHTLDAMIKDGKVWHAGNKSSGLIEQVSLLVGKINAIPETPLLPLN